MNIKCLKKNVNVIYLPTEQHRALGTRSKMSVPSTSNWNLEVFGNVGFVLIRQSLQFVAFKAGEHDDSLRGKC